MSAASILLAPKFGLFVKDARLDMVDSSLLRNGLFPNLLKDSLGGASYLKRSDGVEVVLSGCDEGSCCVLFVLDIEVEDIEAKRVFELFLETNLLESCLNLSR